jgi:hypothetical protein
MLGLLILGLTIVSGGGHNAYKTIRDVDFKNFTFSWDRNTGWASELTWLDPSVEADVRLVNGRWRMPDEEPPLEHKPPRPFAGLVLEQIRYEHVTPDQREQAIVVLRLDSGGTQYSYYVFVYALRSRKPVLLAWFHSGDRSYFGLSRVYVRGGELVVELFDPEKRIGDCCSEGIVRRTYCWKEDRFVEVGSPVFEKAPSVTRIPVTILGNHW